MQMIFACCHKVTMICNRRLVISVQMEVVLVSKPAHPRLRKCELTDNPENQ